MTCWICGAVAVGTGARGEFQTRIIVEVCLAHIASVVLFESFINENYEQAVADLRPKFGEEEMTDLREQISKYFKNRDKTNGYNLGLRHYQEEADQILKLVKDAGYRKLAENQELPNVHSFVAIEAETAGAIVDVGSYQKQAQQDMLKAGFRRVEL